MSTVTEKEVAKISLRFTDAGLKSAIDAEALGFQLKFTHIALGDAESYTPDRTETELKQKKQTVPIQAGQVKKQDRQIQFATVFPGIDVAFWIREVGVYVEDPNNSQNQVLAMIWSEPSKILGYKAEGQELYLSFVASIAQANAENIVIQEADPDFGLLLQSQFDKFFPKECIMTSLDIREDNERDKVASASVTRILSEEIDRLKAIQNPVDFGEFPKYFAPLKQETIQIKEHSSNQNGQWGFSAAQFFLFDKVYTLPAWEGDLAEVSYNLSTQNKHSIQTTDLVNSIILAENEKLIFYIEIEYETDSQGKPTPGIFRVKSSKASEFSGEASPGTLPASPIRIKLAELTKNPDDWIIRASQIKNLDLIDQWQTLKVDGSTIQKISLSPQSDYRVQIINPKRQNDYWIETQGSSVLPPSNLNRSIESDWLDSEQISLWLNVSGQPEESFQMYLNRHGTWQVRSMNPKSWTQSLGVDIGYVHSELIDANDIAKYFPLSAICSGSSLVIEEYLDYADHFAPKNSRGNRVLTAIASRLGIGLSNQNGKAVISVPNFNASPFMRWTTQNIGRYQADALQKHRHIDAGHNHSDAGHVHIYERASHTTRSKVFAINTRAHSGHGNYGYLERSTISGRANIQFNKARLGDPADSGTGAGTPRLDTETRPNNIGFLPLIKVR